MGSLYKRKVREANGEWKELPTWWLKYYQNGRAVRESSSTKSERIARRMLRVREGDVERGIPVNPKMDRFMFEEAAQDLIHDYEANGKKSIRVLKQRIAKHLTPFFQGRRMATIRPTDIRAYVVARQRSVIVTGTGMSRRERHPANGEINRELTTLKRMFSLAVESEKLVRRPHIPLLAEAPARKGFFDRDQVGAICGHLPSPVAAVVRFGYLTGWRIDSEVLTLQWSNVDWKGQQCAWMRAQRSSASRACFPVHRRAQGAADPAEGRASTVTATGPDRPVGLPPRRQAHQELHQGMAVGLSGCWVSRSDSARSTPDRCPEPRAGWCPPLDSHGHGRAQDREHLSSLRHRR